MNSVRPPDLFVITEQGRHPAYLIGEYPGGLFIVSDMFSCIIGVFLINPVTQKLVTFCGVELDIEFEKCKTEIWEIFTNPRSE